MRVLILTTEYLPKIGGSELAIYHLTNRIPDIEFHIVSGNSGGKWLFPMSGFFRGLWHKYDVIHAFQASYAGGAGVLLKLARPNVPFIVTLQEGKDLRRQNILIRLFRDIILKRADGITAISDYLLHFAKRVNKKAKFFLLPNGVDVKMFSYKAPVNPYRIVTASRLVYKNGIDTLIKAMSFLPEDFHLEIFGNGPLDRDLMDLTELLHLGHRVTFAGKIAPEALPERLAGAGVFVRPSRSEGLGSAFLEAMAARVPVVATPVGGIPDFLKEGETGLMVAPDDAQAIAGAIQRITQDADLRNRLVENAYAMVRDRYDWDLLAKQYYEIIRSYSRI